MAVLPRTDRGRALFVEKDETQSTNDDARELALAGAPHGAVVLARRQLAGRGRAGRAFASPEGGLYVSIVLRPEMAPHRWALLPLAVGLSCARVLRSLGFDARVKWPNDLLIGEGKVGGVLVESRMGSQPFAIAGVGINLDAAPLPDATALAHHGTPPGARHLAERIRDDVIDELARLKRDGPASTLAHLRPICVTLGKKVEWEKGEGLAVDLAEDGALVVEAGGRRERVVAGDIRVRQR